MRDISTKGVEQIVPATQSRTMVNRKLCAASSMPTESSYEDSVIDMPEKARIPEDILENG